MIRLKNTFIKEREYSLFRKDSFEMYLTKLIFYQKCRVILTVGSKVFKSELYTLQNVVAVPTIRTVIHVIC